MLWLLAIVCASAVAQAFPATGMSRPILESLSLRDIEETNCGPTPCAVFNAAEQYVDISAGSGHAFIAPTSNDRRGPCPGLNAAANHNFLPRNGILTIPETITGLAKAYGMGSDLAAGLAVLGVLLEGDPISGTWSIGGPYPSTVVDALGEEPQGISFSHNNYEGDSSVTRLDAYLNDGDAYSLNVEKFESLYTSAKSYTLSTLRAIYSQGQNYSVQNNPYFFNAQFSGLLVVPAAHNFIINFMSNHSAELPNGYLDRSMLKSFFGVEGEPGSFTADQGAERIPENWYRRPTSNQYDLKAALADVVLGYKNDPATFKFGGNSNGVNTFTGVDLGNLTGGVYNAENLFEGNNLGCFILQAQQEDFPDILKGLEGDTSPALNLLAKYFDPMLKSLKCPKLEKYNQGLFNQFPGYRYKPTASEGSTR